MKLYCDVLEYLSLILGSFFRWSGLSTRERCKVMMEIADLVEQRLDEFAVAESTDQGKPVWLAKAVDIPRTVLNFRFFATAILHQMNEYVEHSYFLYF